MGFLRTFDCNRRGNVFCEPCKVGEAFFFYGNKRGTHVARGDRAKGKGWGGERESHPEIGGALWQTVGIHFTPQMKAV